MPSLWFFHSSQEFRAACVRLAMPESTFSLWLMTVNMEQHQTVTKMKMKMRVEIIWAVLLQITNTLLSIGRRWGDEFAFCDRKTYRQPMWPLWGPWEHYVLPPYEIQKRGTRSTCLIEDGKTEGGQESLSSLYCFSLLPIFHRFTKKNT